MTTHRFTIVLDRRPTESELEELFANGCDDGAFGTDGAVPIVEFDRNGTDLASAIVAAVHSLESVGLTPVRVVDQDLLTLADIADRIGQSRESVRRYALGARGPGQFPSPINPSRDGVMFYRWSEVAPWLRKNLGIDVSGDDSTLVAANLILQARQLRNRVTNMASLSELLTER
jgi:hypothetical protein